MSWAWLDGSLVEVKDAVLPIDDRGLLLGDGLFETMRSYQSRVFRLADHLERLHRSCSVFNLSLPLDREELAGIVDRLIEKNGLDSARIRITVTRGRHQGAMTLAPGASPRVFITAEPIPDSLEDRALAGLNLATASIRFSENNPVFRHKTLNRLPHLWARTEAAKAGADEALILDERGNVAACSTGNLFVAQSGQVFTPPLGGPILPGVTRKAVIELAREAAIAVREDFFSPLMIRGAEEVFMTNSVQEIVPVVTVDGDGVAAGRPGPLTLRLRTRYREEAERGDR